ncbi:MAG TPA: flagellin hook IN motif-containing protein, partial [Campylobacterales bacterium]|nr:flagellin hook IN motif-containing protein [Campylobacterales bacterium]
MSFRINTNATALNAHNYGVINNRELDSSLGRLSSGLRINSAADDAAGMTIADSLKSQGSALGQSIKNANDAIGILQTADKAMDEQIKILDAIKTKATQAAADSQSALSRQAIQNDIVRLMEELDNIATTTSFNGMSLLSGSFTNKEFQIGAYSNQTIKASIGATSSDKIGSTRFETTTTISASSTAALRFTNPDSTFTQLQGVVISHSASTGLGALAEAINRASDATGVRASYRVVTSGKNAVAAGDITGLKINDIMIGDVINVKSGDANGNLINAVNAVTAQTGVYASVDAGGRMTLTSIDGRGIKVETNDAANATLDGLDSVMQIKMFDKTGFRAADVGINFSAFFSINGVNIGPAATAATADKVAQINLFSAQTGVVASADAGGFITLRGDQRGVNVTTNTANSGNDSRSLGMNVGLDANTIFGNVAPNVALNLNAAFTINGVLVGSAPSGAIVDKINHINSFSSQTGVTASLALGRITLTSADGRLNITSASIIAAVVDGAALGITRPLQNSPIVTGYIPVFSTNQNYGRLTLVSHGSKDIVVADTNNAINTNLNIPSQSVTANLRDVRGNFLAQTGLAAGAYASMAESGAAATLMGSGVTTKTG